MEMTPPAGKPKAIMRRIIEATADRLASDVAIPEANREAYRAQIIHVMEHAVSSILGSDRARVYGWVTPPSERESRRARIDAAIAAGESPAAIASRELVSDRWVRMLAKARPEV